MYSSEVAVKLRCRPIEIKDKFWKFGDCGSVEWLFKIKDSYPF